MAATPSVSSETNAELLELLGRELYDDYFDELKDGDSSGGASADIDVQDNACIIENCINSRKFHELLMGLIPAKA